MSVNGCMFSQETHQLWSGMTVETPFFFTNTQEANMSFMIEQNKCFAEPDIAFDFQEVKKFVRGQNRSKESHPSFNEDGHVRLVGNRTATQDREEGRVSEFFFFTHFLVQSLSVQSD